MGVEAAELRQELRALRGEVGDKERDFRATLQDRDRLLEQHRVSAAEAAEVQRSQSIAAAREVADLRGTLTARDEAVQELSRRVDEALAHRRTAEQELEKLRGGKVEADLQTKHLAAALEDTQT